MLRNRRIVDVACANSVFALTFSKPFQLRMFSSRVSCLRGEKLPSASTICKRNTKHLCITCGKIVCVRVECSIAEESEDIVFFSIFSRILFKMNSNVSLKILNAFLNLPLSYVAQNSFHHPVFLILRRQLR